MVLELWLSSLKAMHLGFVKRWRKAGPGYQFLGDVSELEGLNV